MFRIILFLCSIFFSLQISAFAQRSFDAWAVDQHDDVVRFVTHGEIIKGHQFGFILNTKSNNPILWMTLSSSKNGINNFVDEKVKLKITLKTKSYLVELPIVAVTPFNSLSVVSFSNFIPTSNFHLLLQNSDKITVKIVSPAFIRSKFDIPNETFSLKGYSAARDYAQTLSKTQIEHDTKLARTEEGSAANIVFLFDGLCVQNRNDYSEIDVLVKSFGGKDVTEKVRNFDPVLRNSNGKALGFKYENVTYLVSYVRDGGCTLVTKDINQKALSQLVRKNYKANLIGSTQTGAQHSAVYEVGLKGFKGDLIMINSVSENLDHSEGSIGYISKAVRDRVFMGKN